MSAPNEKSRVSPLHSHYSGVFAHCDGVRLEPKHLADTAPDNLCLDGVKRIEGGESEIVYSLRFRARAVPTLAVLALTYAEDRGSLRSTVALMSPNLREALRQAIDDEDRAEHDADRADHAHDMAQEAK